MLSSDYLIGMLLNKCRAGTSPGREASEGVYPRTYALETTEHVGALVIMQEQHVFVCSCLTLGLCCWLCTLEGAPPFW